ncbi:MAG: prepilin peptidase, partial [bacterium]|nr:prepilin peptidase [bacterium]
PFVELATGSLFLLMYLKSGMTLFSIIYAFTFSVLLVISIIDFKTKEINVYYLIIPVVLLLTGCSLDYFKLLNERIIGSPVAPLLPALIGGTVGGVFVFLVRFIGGKILHQEGLGEGDIYVAIVMGLTVGYELFFYSMIGAGVLGLLFYFLLPVLKRSKEIPFAPFLSLGLFVVFMMSEILIRHVVK